MQASHACIPRLSQGFGLSKCCSSACSAQLVLPEDRAVPLQAYAALPHTALLEPTMQGAADSAKHAAAATSDAARRATGGAEDAATRAGRCVRTSSLPLFQA